MPSVCAIVGCSSTSKKGAKMNRVPRDPVRRHKWIKNCQLVGGMSNWIPNNYSLICEMHFSSNMWEKVRVDGKKKLKNNALPTIFPGLDEIKVKIDEAHSMNKSTADLNGTMSTKEKNLYENVSHKMNNVINTQIKYAISNKKMNVEEQLLNYGTMILKKKNLYENVSHEKNDVNTQTNCAVSNKKINVEEQLLNYEMKIMRYKKLIKLLKNENATLKLQIKSEEKK